VLRLLFAFNLLSLFLLSSHVDKVDYARDIQPILSENCYHCHGPDENTREEGKDRSKFAHRDLKHQKNLVTEAPASNNCNVR